MAEAKIARARELIEDNMHQTALLEAKEAVSMCGDNKQLQMQALEQQSLALVGKGATKDNVASALEASKRMLAIAETSNDQQAIGSAWVTVAKVRTARDRLGIVADWHDDVLKAAEEALEIFQAAGSKLGEAQAQLAIAEARFSQGRLQDTLRASMSSLALARDAKDTRNAVAALHLIVKVLIAKEEAVVAVSAAKEELKLYEQAGDKKSCAQVLRMVASAHTSKDDYDEALIVANQSMKLCREIGDKKGEAATILEIAAMQDKKGNRDAALQSAKDALALFEATGQKAGAEDAMLLLSKLHTLRGSVEKAPNRDEARKYLAILGDAIDARDKDAMKDAMANLKKTESFTEKDVDDLVTPQLEKDRQGTLQFLKGTEVERLAGSVTDEQRAYNCEKHLFYVCHRLGGIAYGPRFQCVNAMRHGAKGNFYSKVYASMQIYNESEDWEGALDSFHCGLMDGSLQAGIAQAVP